MPEEIQKAFLLLKKMRKKGRNFLEMRILTKNQMLCGMWNKKSQKPKKKEKWKESLHNQYVIPRCCEIQISLNGIVMFQQRRRKAKNMVSQTPSAKGGTKNISTSLEFWNLLINDEINSETEINKDISKAGINF